MPYGRILIIDEDAQLRRLISDYLAKDGMESFTLSRIDDLALLSAERATVIILGKNVLTSPEEDIKKLSVKGNTPMILMLSQSEISEAERFLKLGIWDVISKPIDITELSERVQLMIRSVDEPFNTALPTHIDFDGLSVDMPSYTVSVDGKTETLPQKEIELLYLLMSRPSHIFCKAELTSCVWGKVLPDARTVAVHINRIKKKLGPYSKHIVAVRGIGYMFNKEI
ncbi:MAG: response regulator transcription factor [Oscillospiraceae bacterium]|nr:response regulator transcription factor [Oscillospiraceae bacterium]